MKFELKRLSPEAIPQALERAERYRLLNQPEQAESICRDILRVDPDNQKALVGLVLALTDQFPEGLGERLTRAQQAVERLQDPYRKVYYRGLILERRARAQLKTGVPGSGSTAFRWFREAMACYEEAEKIRPSGNDESILRWNSCARSIMDHNLQPSSEETFHPFLE